MAEGFDFSERASLQRIPGQQTGKLGGCSATCLPVVPCSSSSPRGPFEAGHVSCPKLAMGMISEPLKKPRDDDSAQR